jgi:hypothetical protein
MARSTKKKRIEQKAVLIALEDEASSKYYFQALVKDKSLSGRIIFATHKGSQPSQVLNALRRHKEGDKHKQNKKNPKVLSYEKEWIVIDRDDHTCFFSTIKIAKENNICVAFSNEAYELWLFLHFQLVSIHTPRDNLKSQLNQIFRKEFNLDYSKSSQDIYLLLRDKQNTAIENAKTLMKAHLEKHQNIDPSKNPLTTIYQLVECLNSLYSKERNCECFPENRGSI